MDATWQSRPDVYIGLLLTLLGHSCITRTGPSSDSSFRQGLARDCAELQNRYKTEGLPFLTKALPSLGKALDKGLETRFFSKPRHFSARLGKLPAFLGVRFKNVFDAAGCLLDRPCECCVSFIRQVTFMFYKLEAPYSAADTNRVIDNFVSTEGELHELTLPDLRVEESIAKAVFEGFDSKNIMPRHGPGAVSTGEKLDGKYDFKRLYDSIHQRYPYYSYFVTGVNHLSDEVLWYESLERVNSGTTKVVLVPKDSRGPRLIACEPLEYMWLQQGLGRSIVSHLESQKLTRGMINFTSQDINRKLALSSSVTRKWDTIDLKDASDRVSLSLVNGIFNRMPELLKDLRGLRSTHTLLPDGRTLELKKFAPMGSSLCFPVEAFCFWVICVAALVRETGRSVQHCAKSVYVYGDDLIIKHENTGFCIGALEACGLKVNHDKSFRDGSFRESCGMDAFNGVEVTPVKLRTPWSGDQSDGKAYVSYVKTAQQLERRGYRVTAAYLWDRLDTLYGSVPYGTIDSSYPCRVVLKRETAQKYNLYLGVNKAVWDCDLQSFKIRVWAYTGRYTPVLLDDWSRLSRYFSTGVGDNPSEQPLPFSNGLRKRWCLA